MRRQFARRAAGLSALCVALCAGRVLAGADVSDMSLEQLMNEPVTSVSKKATKLSEAAAAIAVVTQEDIRRLGITNVPDALRLVPGLDVAQLSSNQWAVSSRGFNGQLANKLLVLIDGRSVYTPATGGVYWNAQVLMVEDIERIEVIRGPGATLWGANAVNGVINIITQRAQDTQGALVSATDGTQLSRYSVRSGGTMGPDFTFRTYLQYIDEQGFTDSSRTIDTGAWETLRGGFRIDGDLTASDALMLEGDAYGGNASSIVNLTGLTPPSTGPSLEKENNTGSDVLERWTHEYSARSILTVQSYFDHVVQDDGFGTEHRDTYDIDLQHQIVLGSKHAVIWGAGYWLTDLDERPHSFNLLWTPADRDIHSWSAFVQDEITLASDRLHATMGVKFEHTNLAGSNALPNLRLSWTPDERQTIWGAVSRAAATPSLFNLDARVNVAASQSSGGPPTLVSILPNPNLTSEELLAYELGYRFTPSRTLSFELSSFVNHYRHLIVDVDTPAEFELNPAPPHVLLAVEAQNALSATTQGLETSAHWQALPNWQLTASYSWLRINARSSPTVEEQSPRYQGQVRSYLDLPIHLELNTAFYYVDTVTAVANSGALNVPPYIRADAGLVWKPGGGWSVGIWGQNLTKRDHLEFPSDESTVQSEVPRSVIAKIIGTF